MRSARTILIALAATLIFAGFAEAGITIVVSSGSHGHGGHGPAMHGHGHHGHHGPAWGHGYHPAWGHGHRGYGRPVIRSTYFDYPGDGGTWTFYSGRRGYAYKGWFYYPVKSVTGTTRKYKRIRIH